MDWQASDKIAVFAAVIAIASAAASGFSAYFTQQNLELNIKKDVREQKTRLPIVDLRLEREGIGQKFTATINIKNRSDVEILPLDLVWIAIGARLKFADQRGGRLAVLEPEALLSPVIDFDPKTVIPANQTGSIVLVGSMDQSGLTERSPKVEVQFRFRLKIYNEEQSIEVYRLNRTLDTGQ